MARALITVWMIIALGMWTGSVASAADKEPQQESLPRQKVGDLEFTITSFQSTSDGSPRVAHLALTIANHGTSPRALNFVMNKGVLLNDIGQKWSVEHVSGIGVDKGDSGSLNYVAEPKSELRTTIRAMGDSDRDGGNTYKFKAVFTAYRDMGDGRLRKVRTYPVSFSEFHQSSFGTKVKDDFRNIGKDFANTFKDAFHK